MIEFDSEVVRQRLAGLSPWKAAAFGAACAECLLPAYRRYAEIEEVGDPDVVESAVEQVWGFLESGPGDLSGAELRDPDAILALIPNQDEDWNDWSACAENAVAAVSLLLSFMSSGALDYVARAAQQTYEAADYLASAELDLPTVDDASAREILGADVVQAELRRQADACTFLLESDAGPAEIVRTLREGAARQALGRDA